MALVCILGGSWHGSHINKGNISMVVDLTTRIRPCPTHTHTHTHTTSLHHCYHSHKCTRSGHFLQLLNAFYLPYKEAMYFDPDDGTATEMGWWGITAPWRHDQRTPLDYFQDILPREQAKGGQRGAARPLQCVQNPGEIVFVPSGYWHAVLNTAPSVAVTENFASEVNILQSSVSSTP